MKMLRREYAEFLKTGIMPIGLKCFADYMRKCDGAGPLTQIEAFLDYCGELDCVDEKTIDGIRGVEARIRKWDDRDKANYYAISAEILKADPEIFGEFIEVFGRIKEEEDFLLDQMDIKNIKGIAINTLIKECLLYFFISIYDKSDNCFYYF